MKYSQETYTGWTMSHHHVKILKTNPINAETESINPIKEWRMDLIQIFFQYSNGKMILAIIDSV